MTSDHLVVLSHPAAVATKVFRLEAGKIVAQPYGQGKYFRVANVPVSDIVSLATAVDDLSTETYAFVVRGELCAGRDAGHARRTSSAQSDEPAGFFETPRRWAMLDIDGIVGTFDLATAAGCEAAHQAALARLPEICRTTAHYWQLSSSTGIKKTAGCHLWYWLDRPMNGKALTAWAEELKDAVGNAVVDAAVFRTIQPHYVAAPIFDIGVHDPVAVRAGFAEGTRELALPDVRAAMPGQQWAKRLAPLYDPLNTNVHEHVRNACAAFFCSRGPDADPTDLRKALRDAVLTSCEMRGVETSYDAEKLDAHIESGRAFAARQKGAPILRDAQGQVLATLSNGVAIVTVDPQWEGCIAWNDRKSAVVLRRAPPFDEARAVPCLWEDKDDRALNVWLERTHTFRGPTYLAAEIALTVAHANVFDPVAEYLAGLRWDGEPRLETWLRDICGAEDTPYTRKAGAMWLIQAVARALSPGCKADCVLVLSGRQGAYKSSLFRELAGGIEYFREGVDDIRSVETMMLLQSAWIVELREMSGTTRDVEATRTFLDRQNDFYRPKYGRHAADHPRRCVFAATTNDAHYLQDAAGARRFWPIAVPGTIDLEAAKEARDQLWAEAAYRYRAGEAWWLDADDPDFVGEQEARYDVDEREETIREALDKGADGFLPFPATPKIAPVARTVRVTQVLEHVFKMPTKDQKKGEQMFIGKCLKRLGWVQKHNGAQRIWYRPGTEHLEVVLDNVAPVAMLGK